MIKINGHYIMVLRGGHLGDQAAKDLYGGICDLFMEGNDEARITTDHIDAKVSNSNKCFSVGNFTGYQFTYEFEHETGKGRGAILLKIDPSYLN